MSYRLRLSVPSLPHPRALAVAVLSAAMAVAVASSDGDLAKLRKRADSALGSGNYAEAFEAYEKLLIDGPPHGAEAASDLDDALWCLQKINRIDEFDSLATRAIERHGDNWLVLRTAARHYLRAPHYGYRVAGEFRRGPHRGGGERLDSYERDRARAIQLLDRAVERIPREAQGVERAAFWEEVARALSGADQGMRDAWRLQYLTDLESLPPFDEAAFGFMPRLAHSRGAPVDAQGNPVYHTVPSSWAASQTDGQRWRWAMQQATRADAQRAGALRLEFADFLHAQFGVHTLKQVSWWPRLVGDADDLQAGVVQLRTLSAEETIARLAIGVRRFPLPREFNFLRIYADVAQNAEGVERLRALKSLAEIYEDRRQYDMAANCWQNAMHLLGAQEGDRRELRDATWRHKQITANWGELEPTTVQPADAPAHLTYRFRNGRRAGFNARAVKLDMLLDEVRNYLRARPEKPAPERLDLDDLGYRLVVRNEERYLETQAQAWVVGLEPPEGHIDRRARIQTPLTDAGAYLVTATMDRGNLSRAVLWIADLSIVKKPMRNGDTLLFVADARSGAPAAGCRVDCLGYRQEMTGRNRYRTEVEEFHVETDSDGLARIAADRMAPGWRWLIAARAPDGRSAFLGWTLSSGARAPASSSPPARTYVITDRPVYRPGHTLHFKIWARRADYASDGPSAFAGQTFRIEIRDPRNKSHFDAELTADEYGGMEGRLRLAEDAPLGAWSVRIPADGNAEGLSGAARFRVEEYRKPEFEVLVEAPQVSPLLGETFDTLVRARYYFGEPVRQGRVYYKVTRTARVGDYAPAGPWDWLYGRAYGTGPNDLGSLVGAWWPTPRDPPEVVAEGETALTPDGSCHIPIDTSLAKALHGDRDHDYRIVAEVTDPSRRTVAGDASVTVGRRPFQVDVWTDAGYARQGEVARFRIAARSLGGQAIAATGRAELRRVSYADPRHPTESTVQSWDIAPGTDAPARIEARPTQAGYYRLVCALADERGRQSQGERRFHVAGSGAKPGYHFDALEIETDRLEYTPGDNAGLLIGFSRPDATVLLFPRAEAGCVGAPRLVRLAQGAALETLAIEYADMPGIFVEALCVADARAHSAVRQIRVPPRGRILEMDAAPERDTLAPGDEAVLDLALRDAEGRPFQGAAVVSVYDRALEYIGADIAPPDIRAFFWKWNRYHSARNEHNLDRIGLIWHKRGEKTMAALGAFGNIVARENADGIDAQKRDVSASAATPLGGALAQASPRPNADNPIAPSSALRRDFADAAYWNGAIITGPDGRALVRFNMPDDTTSWRVRAWAMGRGARVGQTTAHIATKRDLLARLQMPRFLVQGDEALISGNIHNYLPEELEVQVSLEIGGRALDLRGRAPREIDIAPDGQQRADWEVRADEVGETTVRLTARAASHADGVDKRLPVAVRGIGKTFALCGYMAPEEDRVRRVVFVPSHRDEDSTELIVRFSPGIASAMLEAIPYLHALPEGSTDQTLNRFLPTILARRALAAIGVDLHAMRAISPALTGHSDATRDMPNPVFDPREADRRAREGIAALAEMQLADGGWGWFSGTAERSDAHTTAWVMRGLLESRLADFAPPDKTIERGLAWLDDYRQRQFDRLLNYDAKTRKAHPDNLDALVYCVLAQAGRDHDGMRAYLLRDRDRLSAYGKALLALAMHNETRFYDRDLLLANIEQLIEIDPETQTAWLRLPEGNARYFWHGNEMETLAAYLKLLVAAGRGREPQTAWLVRYLVNNRRHGAWWQSPRDTAFCIEAIADYLKATGETQSASHVEVLFDGRTVHEAQLTPLSFLAEPGTVRIGPEALDNGRHHLEIRKSAALSGAGRRHRAGALYYNAFLRYFTTARRIEAEGLELRVRRALYRLNRTDAQNTVADALGRPTRQQADRYERERIESGDEVRSGDLLEVELTVTAKNDFEQVVLEDPRAAGCEPAETRSGYNGNALGAYVEFGDRSARFFVRRLTRGEHSVSYRLRAETPGRYTALPATVRGVYAPDLRGNSESLELEIEGE